MDHIAGAINAVLYPNAEKKVIEGESRIQTFTIVIQNFTGVSVSHNPTLNDPTGQFSANVEDCKGSMGPNQGCIITASFDPQGVALTSTYSASIVMGNGEIVPLSISIRPQVTTENDDSSDSSDESGGSMGTWMLLSLLLFGGFRRNLR